MKKFFEEFKKFALRGNVMDLAVGMIIGSAFTAIVTALKDNLIQPILDFVTRTHTADYYTKEVLLGYLSAFISAVINFFIIAFVLFIIIKFINRITAKRRMKNPKFPQQKYALKARVKFRLKQHAARTALPSLKNNFKIT